MSTEEMDDFGDLYADLEGPVNAGISSTPNIHRPHEEDEENRGSKAKEAGSDTEDHALFDRTGGTGSSVERMEASDEKSEQEMEEGGDCSDSEDDLHIVLNEEDGGYGVGLGNGGDLAEGSDKEEEDDDLVIVTGTSHQNKDRKRADTLQLAADGSEYSGADRAISSKGGYLSQYSHYKYVRSHSGISSKTRAVGSGGVVPFSSPTPGRCDWDVNSGSQVMVPCSVVTTSNVANPADVQHGFDFHMPRNRSIFDVRIDTFERKPWRNQGVDITDFFNFGLNEESWNQYCECLEHFRKQTAIQRMNQVLESQFSTEVESGEAMSNKASQFGQDELITLKMEKPKGRAIRVEGGFGERRPSMDIRRPRHRDSDAVIQITMEGSPGDASTPDNEEPDHVADIVKFENGVCEGSYATDVSGNLLSLDHDDRKKKELTKLDDQHNQHSKTSFKDCDNGNPPREDSSVSETESASGDHILRSSSPSNLDSHSEGSRDEISSDKVLSPAKKSSLGSVSGLKDAEIFDDYLYSDSRSNANEKEREDSRDSFLRHDIIQEERRSCRPRKLRSLAELKVVVADDDHVFSRKECNDVDLLEMSSKTKERKYDGNYNNEGLPSQRKTEMSIRYGSGRKRVSEKSHIKHSHRRCDLDPDPRIYWDRRDSFLEKRATSMGNGIKQNGTYSHERGQNSRSARGLTHKECTHSVSEHRYLHVEEDWCSWQRSVKKDDNRILMEDVKRHRHREGCTQEWHGKHMKLSDEEVESIQHKFGRHIPYNIRELKSPKRSKYDRDPHFKMSSSRRYAENDGKNWRHPDFSSSVSETYRDSWIVDERGLHDVIRPRNDSSISWRSSERYADCWQLPYIRNKQSKKQRNRDSFSPSSEHVHVTSYGRDHDFENGYIHLPEEATCSGYAISSEEERYGWLSRPSRRNDDEVSFRHQRRDNSDSLKPLYLCENRLKHEKISGNHNPVTGAKFLNSVDSARKKVFAQGNTDSEARERNDAFRHRGTVSRHLNGWEGKFGRRCSEVAVEGNKRSDADLMLNEAKDSFYHIKELHRQNVVPPGSTKMEGDFSRTISSKVERMINCKSDHQIWPDKHPSSPDVELEEGQLIEEPEMEDTCPVTKKWDSEETAVPSGTEANQSGNNEGKAEIQLKDTARNDETIEGYDRNRILETLAKLEKRRERFKLPIAPIKEHDTSPISLISDLVIEADEVKQKRPTRKRRWVAS